MARHAMNSRFGGWNIYVCLLVWSVEWNSCSAYMDSPFLSSRVSLSFSPPSDRKSKSMVMDTIDVVRRLASIQNRALGTDEMTEKGLLEQQRQLEELQELTKKQRESQVPPKDDAKTSTKMTLFGAQKWDTKPLQCRSLEQVNEFFSRPENANMLFHEDTTVQEIQPSPEILQEWEKIQQEQSDWRDSGMNLDYSLIVGGDPGVTLLPTPLHMDRSCCSSTRFVEIINPPMAFMGLSLCSVSTIAIQFFPGDMMEYPEYQYTLLHTSYHAKGPSFLVWLFNKMLGIKKNYLGNADPNRLQSMGFTRVFCKDLGSSSGAASSFMVSNHARIEAHVNIPPFLLSLLPMSTEQMEAQGSETIKAEITNDIQQAMERFQKAFETYSSAQKM